MDRLIKIALLAGVSWACLAIPSSADPISATLITATGLFAAGSTAFAVATSLTTLALSGAANFGLSLFARKMTKKPRPSGGGVQGQADVGVETYRKVIFGLCPTDGRPVYWKGVGSSNSVFHMVWQICDWECQSLVSVIINGVRKTLTPINIIGNETARYTVEGFGTNFILKFFSGAWGQGHDTELVAASSDTAGQTMGPWTSSHIGKGVCYASAILTFDQNLFQSGFPQVKFEVRGAKLYDIRKDSTSGGSGTHRWSDPTTWEYSENPAICDLNYELGFWRNGQLLLGKGTPLTRLLINQYIASANICDESLLEGGLPTKRYACCVTATSEAEHRSAKEAFGLAMAADFITSNGLSAPIAAAAASVYPVALTDDDVISSEDHEFTTQSDDPYNAVSCKFVNPDTLWQSDDLPLLSNTTWEASDGGDRLIKDIDLTSVPYKYQAARIQSLLHNQSRMSVSNTDTFHRKFSDIDLGDWVTRTFNRDGYGAVSYTMKVAGITRHLDRCVTLSLVQCAAANHVPPNLVPSVSLPILVTPRTTVSLLTGFSIQAGQINSGQQSRPTIAVAWANPNDPSVTAVQIEYRLLNNAFTARVERAVDVGVGGVVLSGDILAGTTYEVRIRPEYTWGGVGIWTPYSTTDTSSSFSVISSRLATDTTSLMLRAWQQSDASDMLANALEAIRRYENDWNGTSQTSRETMRVGNAANTAFASIDTFKGVYAADQLALAVTLTALNATVGGVSASIATEATTRADADTALSSYIATVEANSAGASAGGLFKIEAESTPAGAVARMIASVRVATTGTELNTTFRTAGWVMEVFDSGGGIYKGRMVIEADQFAIKNSGTPFVPFAVIGAETFINSLTIGGTIKSSNYVAGKTGFALMQDGTADFQNITVGGGTSSTRPFELNMGSIQGGVVSGEAKAAFIFTFNISVKLGNGSTTNMLMTLKGFVRRSPTFVEYDFTTNFDGVTRTFFSVVPKALNVPWSPLTVFAGIHDEANYAPYSAGAARTVVMIGWDVGGTCFAYTTWSHASVGSVRNATIGIRAFLNEVDQDPLFRNGFNPSTIYRWNATPIGGIRLIQVPATVVGMDVWMWGAAAPTNPTGFSTPLGFGGPGGFVKFRRPVTAGSMLSILTGNSIDQGYQGFGLNDPGEYYGINGGGGSFIFDGKDDRSRLIAVAGGGGGGHYTVRGGCGGSTSFGGGNGIAATDMTRCFGQSGLASGQTFGRGGGGGYEGGGMNASPIFGKGGTSYTDSLCYNVVKTVAPEAANGSHTGTGSIPGSSEAVYTSNAGITGDPQVAAPNATAVGPGGGGLVAIQWLTSL